MKTFDRAKFVKYNFVNFTFITKSVLRYPLIAQHGTHGSLDIRTTKCYIIKTEMLQKGLGLRLQLVSKLRYSYGGISCVRFSGGISVFDKRNIIRKLQGTL